MFVNTTAGHKLASSNKYNKTADFVSSSQNMAASSIPIYLSINKMNKTGYFYISGQSFRT